MPKREVNAKPFPVDALPNVMQKYVKQASEINGYDPSAVAVPLLSTLARAINNKAIVELPNGFSQPAIIWSMVVVQSGMRKSSAVKDATVFLTDKEDAHGVFNGDKLMAANYTGIALLRRLNSNFDSSILVYIDELAGFFHSYSKMSTKHAEKNELLSCYDATAISVERVRKEDRFHIQRPNVSITGTIQTDRFIESLGHEYLTDGMCARFLLTLPEAPRFRLPKKPKRISAVVKYELAEVFDQLLSMPSAEKKGAMHVEPLTISLAPKAWVVYRQYVNRLEAIAEGPIDKNLKIAYGKLGGYAARIALIFTLVKWADELNSVDPEELAAFPDTTKDLMVDRNSMISATKVMKWFQSEYVRIYGLFSDSKEERLSREFLTTIKKNFSAGFAARDLYDFAKSRLSEKDKHGGVTPAIEKILNHLIAEDELVRKIERTGGHPSTRYYLTDNASSAPTKVKGTLTAASTRKRVVKKKSVKRKAKSKPAAVKRSPK